MAAALFHLPTSRIIDSNGIADGSTLTFYDTGTLTPRAVYTTSALSVEHPNPLTVAAGAAVPDIYLNDAYTYRLIVKNAAGTTIDDIDPYIGFSASGLNFIQSGTGAVTRTGEAKLRDAVSVLDFIPVANHAAIAADTSTTDVTSYVVAALAAHDHILFPSGTYTISSFSVPAGKRISTDGFATKFKQASGTATATPLIKVTGSNVTIGSCQVEGQLNQAGDTTGEFNHGIHIALVTASAASITNVSVGDVKGTNIRGDVIYIGSNATAYTAGYRVAQVSVGHVYGSNVYRNVVSVTGGTGISVASVDGVEVGFMHFDIEPDAGVGPVSGVRVGYVKGCYAGVVPTDDEAYADGVEIGTLDLDPSYTTGSTPAYAAGASLEHALEIRNCKSLKIAKFKANGFDGQALKQTWNSGELAKQFVHIGHAELTDCCKTEATNLSYINGATDGTGGVTQLTIGSLDATVTRATVAVVKNCTNARIGPTVVSLAATTYLLRGCNFATLGPVTTTSTTTGIIFLSCTKGKLLGGAVNVDIFSSFSDNVVAIGATITAVTPSTGSGTTQTNFGLVDTSLNGTYHHFGVHNTNFRVDIDGNANVESLKTFGSKVVGQQGAAVADATDAATAITQLNALLARLRTHGLIAT